MITVEEYLKDPCGTLSIPYWKAAKIQVPAHMRIVHHSEFSGELQKDYDDTPYFRLYHSLEHIEIPAAGEVCIEQVKENQISLLADVINACYKDLSVTAEQLENNRRTKVFDEGLWIITRNRKTGEVLGCGIADLDSEMEEGVLEWIQVLPRCRRQGIGRTIVNELLLRLKEKAKFVTVSGKVGSDSKPELLYRSCGFTGSDVWHILMKK